MTADPESAVLQAECSLALARAIETGDVTQLPSRRDEDWRWTDLRGLIRVLPGPKLDRCGTQW